MAKTKLFTGVERPLLSVYFGLPRIIALCHAPSSEYEVQGMAEDSDARLVQGMLSGGRFPICSGAGQEPWW